MALPLVGIRVLDLTNVLAGPFCCDQLAQLGAEVIKVEVAGGGDLARQLGADPALNEKGLGILFLSLNAGKRSLTVNLKATRGKEIFRRLVRTADVLVENFRPGVMKRLGLAYDDLKGVNPRLVYCAISGFGQDGPLASQPAYDQIVQGMSGIMSVTGDAETAPLRVGFPVCDTLGGLTAAFAISSALAGRGASGEGRFVDVSMLESALAAMGWVVSNWLMAGQVPVPMGNENFTASPSGTFTTGDGLLNIAANKQEHFIAACQVIGRPELTCDKRFAERETRRANRAALKAEFETALAAKPAAEWDTLFNAAGIPAGRVLSVPEVFDHPQIAARHVVRTVPAPPGVDRAVAVTRPGFRLSDGDPGPAGPPPLLGEHSAAILGELGYDADEIAALREAKIV
jgi:crotonobetainyl-CoA:carnitine CoA-transferase CaiB-like acyl-CoA transferase